MSNAVPTNDSTATFQQFNLNPLIVKALEYPTPTPIQSACIPEIMAGKEVIASAQTGTGKTAAFVLPLLHKLSTSKLAHKPRVLILSPTRELATQITTAIKRYSRNLKLTSVSLVGGMPYPPQIRALSRAVDIVVATPGRLLDLLSNRRLDLSMIETVVLDEADRMLDMGFIDDVSDIVKLTPENRQILLFSATVDGKLARLAQELIKAPIRIDLTPKNVTPTTIKQAVYMSDHSEHKNKLLTHLLQNENIYKAIIFSATKINADTLAINLRKQGYAVAALHSDLKQNARERTLRQLRTGQIQLLVATDIAARGIDISDISHVINYDLPRTAEDYVHRIGRAGRAGRDGIALTFALFSEIGQLKRIEYSTKQQLNREIVPGLAPVSKPKSDVIRKKRKKQTQKKAGAAPKRFYSGKPNTGSAKAKRSGKPSQGQGASSNRSAKPNQGQGVSSNYSAKPSQGQGASSSRSAKPNQGQGASSNRSGKPSSQHKKSGKPGTFAKSGKPGSKAGRPNKPGKRPEHHKTNDHSTRG